MRAPLLLAVLVLSLPSAAAAQDTLPPGSPIAEGVGLDITEAGFDHLLGLVDGLLPPDLVIGSIPPQDVADLLFCTLQLELDNLIVHSTINEITIDGTPDALLLHVDMNVWINTPDDPAIVTISGCSMDTVCLLYTDPANFLIDVPISFAMGTNADGDPIIDVTIGELSHNIEAAMQNKVHMTDCFLGDLNEALSVVGLNIFDLVVAEFVTELESTIGETLADLEVTIEEAFAALWLSDTTEVLDTELTYDIHPTAVEHNDDGLRLVLGGSVTAPPHQCVERFTDDGGGSVYTPSNMPPMTATVPGSGDPYHLAALLSDDLVNQGFFAVWQGGVLCYVVEDLGSTVLTTTYLGLLLGLENEERLAEILGTEDEVPMLIRTMPETPPVARFDGDHDITVDVEGLNIQFYPLILDRFANLASVAIDVHAGVDIGLAPDDALQIDVFLDSENLNPRVTYNEIAEDLNPAFEGNFVSFVGVVIDTVAGSLLEGMTFGLPTVMGQGRVGLETLAVGESPALLDFLGAYATLGETTGGESSGGCDSCGDGGGCSDCTGEGGCLEESGCGGEDGCDVTSIIGEESGCTGEPSEQPDDTGCVSCRIATTTQVSAGHWRITVPQEGSATAGVRHVPHRMRAPLSAVLVIGGPLLVIARRRRSAAERRQSA